MMIVWLAGWPKNGTTLCRQIIEQCFGIKTYSRYEEPQLEFLFPGANEFLKDLSRDPAVRLLYLHKSPEVYFIKTHELPGDDYPAVFCSRDGRDACASLSDFYRVPLMNVICGQNMVFANWSGYYYGWCPQSRPETLIVRYEDMLLNPAKVAGLIGRSVLGGMVPGGSFKNEFADMVDRWPRFFKRMSGNWSRTAGPAEEAMFWALHGSAMRELGYSE
jgi:hypothetical protein